MGSTFTDLIAGKYPGGLRESRELRENTPQPREPAPSTDLHGLSLADLEAAAWPDEWREIEGDPLALTEFARSLVENKQIEQAAHPERFGHAAECARCGPVWLPAWQAGRRVSSCPWCEIRRAGGAIPRPERVPLPESSYPPGSGDP